MIEVGRGIIKLLWVFSVFLVRVLLIFVLGMGIWMILYSIFFSDVFIWKMRLVIFYCVFEVE